MAPKLNSLNRVLLLSSEYPPGPGGIGNHAFSLSKALARKGMEVFVVCDADYASQQEVEFFDQTLPKSVYVNRVYREGIRTYFKRIQFAARIIKQQQISRVIVSGRFSLWTGAMLKIFGFKVHVMAVLHGSEVNLTHRLFRIVTRLSLQKADLLVAVSEFTYSLLPEKLKRKPFRIIPNGIDVGEFSCLDERSESMNIKGFPRLLTVGNVTPRKGQHRVIKALPQLIKLYPDIHYHIVGLPTCKDDFLQLAQKLGVSNYVTFHGRLAGREQLAGMYKSSNCFVILSENQKDGDVEGFGIVVLEANYFGLPAIGALGCGIADAIENGTNGFLVDGDNPQQIGEALQNILAIPEQFAEGSHRWAGLHDWEIIGGQFAEALYFTS